ncbi:MAG TPA: hypothetical protein VII92_02375 [Anaerolineae bacterium]
MKTRTALSIALVTLLTAITFASTQAQSGSGYNLTWNTIDNGGGTIGNSSYTLSGTIGQADAGAPIGNGGYTLAGGFWAGVSSTQYHIYLPIVLRR